MNISSITDPNANEKAAGQIEYDENLEEIEVALSSPSRSAAPSLRRQPSWAGSLEGLDYPEEDLEDDITSFYPTAFRRDTEHDLGEEDVSPKSIADPALRRLTIPELDTMPGSEESQAGGNSPASMAPSSFRRPSAASSFRRPSVSDLEDLPDNEEESAPASQYDDYSIMAQPPNNTFPLPRMPSTVVNTYPSPSLSIPDRPPLLTANSSDPLLGDVSGSSTPITP